MPLRDPRRRVPARPTLYSPHLSEKDAKYAVFTGCREPPVVAASELHLPETALRSYLSGGAHGGQRPSAIEEYHDFERSDNFQRYIWGSPTRHDD